MDDVEIFVEAIVTGGLFVFAVVIHEPDAI
jgi:hypothetical protein